MPASEVIPAAGEARIQAEGEGRYLVLGTLTFTTVPQIYGQGQALFDKNGAAITFDLEGIKRTDSAGLALLTEWMRLAQRQNKTIRFQNIPAQLLAIARLSGLESLLPLA